MKKLHLEDEKETKIMGIEEIQNTYIIAQTKQYLFENPKKNEKPKIKNSSYDYKIPKSRNSICT